MEDPVIQSTSDQMLQHLAEAASAVRAEQRASSKSVLLRCQKVVQAREGDDTLFALEITRFARMDWTWEGARAFADSSLDVLASHTPAWSGDVVEVDEVASRIFVSIHAGAPLPTVGDFVVQPFNYLEALDSLYNGDASDLLEPVLSTRLGYASGASHPTKLNAPSIPAELQDVWGYSHGYIWGPPGTGKTYTLGQQVARAVRSERILVLSTTNKATDGAAISIASTMRSLGQEPNDELISRIGSGSDIREFREKALEQIVDRGETGMRDQLADLQREHRRATTPEDRASIWARIQEVRKLLSLQTSRLESADSRVVVATSFMALLALSSTDSLEDIARGTTPFTTVVVDESGLLSRAAIAALSLWGSRRLVLYGDPKQLSPISRISRVLEPSRSRWIARSGLDHLRSGEEPGVRLLTTQYRMHPDIRKAVSDFQYGGLLQDADKVASRPSPLTDPVLSAGPRAIWYVLDDETGAAHHLRADRGPGGRSWTRKRSQEVVERIFRAHPNLGEMQGMFVSPFVAQARELSRWFAQNQLERWSASTAHAQQGSEADVVLFDTVHAGSTAWSHAEWQRLLNVGMSRARHLLILLSSRLEMREPFLRRLQGTLRPMVIRGAGGQYRWHDSPLDAPNHEASLQQRERDPSTLGAQLEARKSLRPILSSEQQRLCLYPLDGKPRLVRGVAGSGKTAVLAHWLARRVSEAPEEGPFWVVYANQALRGLIQSQVDDVWRSMGDEGDFPWQAVHIIHVMELLEQLERERGLRFIAGGDKFDFEARATRLLEGTITPRCRAMFVDEAQDCGESTIALLARLVEPTDPSQPGQKAINIFYDNAQNVYGRGTPRWVDLGIDMVGRSTVMKESFRATLPSTEFALNTLYRLESPGGDPDHAELLSRDLLHEEQRNGRRWWRVRFNEVDGPLPDFRLFPERDAEHHALRERIVNWIRDDGVRPADIRVLANGTRVRDQLVTLLAPALDGLGVRIENRTSAHMTSEDDLLLVTTPHSFKGYDSEIVAIPAADKFIATVDGNKSPLPHPLYVAMTRARSVLYVSCIARSPGSPAARIVEALQTTFEDQRSVPSSSPACTEAEEHIELLERMGPEHRSWLQGIVSTCKIESGPILRSDGSIVAAPLFRYRGTGGEVACFLEPQTPFVIQELDDLGFQIVSPGEGV